MTLLGPDGRAVTSRPQSTEHAFDAARRTGYRGFFYFPTLEPDQQMPLFTRDEIARKSNWLYNNVGAVRCVIDGLGMDEVDTGIWPKATTSKPDFNREVSDAFHEENGEARVFHEAAVENYYSAQFAIRRHIRLHGELFGQELRPGQGSAAPSMNFLPCYQIRNASTRLDQSLWREGVMLNPAGRALAYRVVTNREGTKWSDVPADDMLHFHDQFWIGQSRGLSGLAPVAKKLFSIDDITRAETNGVLLRSRLAYAITNKNGDDGAPSLTIPGVSSTEEVATPDGGTLVVQKIVSPYGDEVDVADLKGGRDIKVLESTRSVPVIDFTKSLLTDVAYCTLYPPEYVFFLGGIGQGTLARLILLRVRRVKNTVRQFQLIPQFCKRWYTFWLWQRIKAGRFSDPPADWWRVKHICPADDTVDIGREGKLYDSRLETGKMSPESYHGVNGEDAEDVEDEIIAARVRREHKIKKAIEANPEIADRLSHDSIFTPSRNSAAPVAAKKPEEVEEDEE